MLSRLKSYMGAPPAPELSEDDAATALRAAVAGDITADTELFVTDSCLRRYLRARSNDVEKARRMLQTSLHWRSTYRPDTLVPRLLPTLQGESATGKMFVLPVADAHGRSVIVMRPGLENSSDTGGKVANLVYTLERACALAERHGALQFVVVVDYGVGVMSAATVPSLSVSRETTNILQSHYPERLCAMVLVKAPRIFLSVFKVLRPLIDAKTRDKLHFVQDGKEVAAIDGVDADALPAEYGGNMDWKFDVHKYFEADPDAKAIMERQGAAGKGEEAATQPSGTT